MKMKQISALMVGVLLVSETLAQERERIPPKLEQVKSITLKTKPAYWIGIFYSNGAAMLELDSTGLKSQAFAPKESFSFEKTYALLIPHLRSSRELNYSIFI